MTTLKLIVSNSKFWMAVYVLARVTLHYLVPNFPAEIQTALDSVVIITLSIMLRGDVKQDKIDMQAGG